MINLSPDDQVALVTYSGNAKVLLSPTLVARRSTLIKALQKVSVGGKSDPIQGFQLAYEMAQNQFTDGANNKIILITDGGFPIEKELPKLVEENAYKQIPLTVFYFGKNESQMQTRLSKLAKIGRGNYRHINKENASHFFLDGVLQTNKQRIP